MQENWQDLINNFHPDNRCVLAVIVKTQGATYRKAGTMMLIDEQGQCTGLLSGGCLEADIVLHSKSVFNDLAPKLIQYDLMADADLLWGLGLGCEGAIDIALLPLTAENNYLGFVELLGDVKAHKAGRYLLAIPPYDQPSDFPIGRYLADHQASPERLNERWLSIPVTPPVSIAIVGAGPDAVPVAQMALQMGWHVTVFDHRDNALSRMNFSADIRQVKLRAEKASETDFQGIDAAVVMTHNLAFDQNYLACLLQTAVPYIGLLGPVGRRDKLLSALDMKAADVAGRVFGPVGLPIGGRSPQAIALSIVSEIQQQNAASLAKRNLLNACELPSTFRKQ
ncbi:XdhC/CoxI family protein [Thalassotalea euphylliae]|uniref:XdhC/CoxI family protein n=1 Tax=Thalassotalea euphylliae TaxID=1655234 RepID=A0A3E0TPH3_9GAMM|nr:XdhC/CoxI family protein [Thalassotalea euphylliae]REL25972.1 XdhC/CoxI family protein [Thalassotalea euphylliae]